MPQFSNVIEVLNLLDKSNCGKCGEKACMAFAAAVFTGKKQLQECPTVASENVQKYGKQERKQNLLEEEGEKVINELKKDLSKLDLRDRAEQVNGVYSDDKITLKIMGKDISVDSEGNIFTPLHANSFIITAVLNYINYSKGLKPTSNWMPLRELPSGQDWYRLFNQQCEKILKKTADGYGDLFSDLVHMFNGKRLNDQFKSDVAVVLLPLPLVPMLICYWKPEEGMESELGVFFDDTAESNLGMDGLYSLGVGFAFMLEKLARLHGTEI